jgi:hypothetical protein
MGKRYLSSETLKAEKLRYHTLCIKKWKETGIVNSDDLRFLAKVYSL